MKQTSVIVAMGLISALAAPPVFAQTNTTNTNTTANTNTAAATGQWMTKPGADQWLVSHLKGLDVYDQNNQKLAGIDELLSNHDGQIQAAVLSIGGFLGAGARLVAVPFNQLHFVDTPVNGVPVTANNTAPVAPANAPAIATRTANAPGNPTANNLPNAGLGGAAPGVVTPTNTNGAVIANRAAINRNPNVPDHAVLNMTLDQLKNAPEFKYNNP